MTNPVLLLARLLQAVHLQQMRWLLLHYGVADVLASKPLPALEEWGPQLAEATKPLLLQAWQAGMLRTAARNNGTGNRSPVPLADPGVIGPGGILDLVAQTADGGRSYRPGNGSIFGEVKGVMWNAVVMRNLRAKGQNELPLPSRCLRPVDVTKASRAGTTRDPFPRVLGWPTSKALTNPKVIDAVDAAVLIFCRETLATATRDLDEAIADLRTVLRAGLKRGDKPLSHTTAAALLAGRVRQIFADPARAARVAATEYARATYGGQTMAAKERGAKYKTWLASGNACTRCMELHGKRVKIDKPFFVDKVGGPYASVYHPPAHPHCHCDQMETYG